MTTAGYSKTPLLKKLGLKTTHKLLLINEPPDYHKLIEADISEQLCKKNETPDFIHFFVKNKIELATAIKKIKPFYKKKSTIIIWVSWLKKSSGLSSDVDEDVIRNLALQNDLIDVKVCAVSNIWSGLKLVVPLKKRL